MLCSIFISRVLVLFFVSQCADAKASMLEAGVVVAFSRSEGGACRRDFLDELRNPMFPVELQFLAFAPGEWAPLPKAREASSSLR